MRNKNCFAQKAFTVLLSLALILPGCGGGGGGGSSLPRQPALIPAQALNAPVTYRRDGVQIGGDVRPSLSRLSPAGTHGEVAISSGRIRDGESSGNVKEYLKQHSFGSESIGDDYSLLMFNTRPVVRIRETTADKYVDDVVRVVELINQALPYEHRMTISPERAPEGPILTCEGDVCRSGGYIPRGQIFVGISPQRTWAVGEKEGDMVSGVAHCCLGVEGVEPAYAVWVDSEVLRDHTGYIRFVLAHELFHALGMNGHIDRSLFWSVMNTRVPWAEVNNPYVLEKIDIDALSAIFEWLYTGERWVDYDPNELGPWTDVSFHLRGDMDDVSFGASSRNGLIQPWAHGPSPSTNLSGMGSASWAGRLLGFTSKSESLAGAADLTINLVSLDGQLDFTGLEHWGVHTAPGPIGSGTMWNDGDLRYSVIVRGNTFNQTGGDAGEVTGAFFGARHEGMGGVVERSDMSAGFGGSR